MVDECARLNGKALKGPNCECEAHVLVVLVVFRG